MSNVPSADGDCGSAKPRRSRVVHGPQGACAATKRARAASVQTRTASYRCFIKTKLLLANRQRTASHNIWINDPVIEGSNPSIASSDLAEWSKARKHCCLSPSFFFARSQTHSPQTPMSKKQNGLYTKLVLRLLSPRSYLSVQSSFSNARQPSRHRIGILILGVPTEDWVVFQSWFRAPGL